MDKQKRNRKLNITPRRLLFCALLIVFITIGAVAVYNLVIINARYSAAQNEYADLRQYAPATTPEQRPAGQTPTGEPEGASEPGVAREAEPETMSLDLSAINPDYIGWIRIEGTNIDYPVVQTTNNVKYLNTTFRGERNNSGTIFMDSESTEGFSGFAILHGHNMKDGTMFAELHSFLDSEFRDTYREIIIILPDGETLAYQIFDVRLINVDDIDFTLPENITGVQDNAGILVLSTCTFGDRNERLLILARQR